MSAPSTFDYTTDFQNTPTEIETKCHFKEKSFDLFKSPHVGFNQSERSENLLKLLIIIAYDTNKILRQSQVAAAVGGGALKKNKKNKRSQKRK
uniref:Uncharacterized protein n=1 Tax=viral metagenome TaxID=1070528 RepID=A0A6C0CDW7_9ZZZZ